MEQRLLASGRADDLRQREIHWAAYLEKCRFDGEVNFQPACLKYITESRPFFSRAITIRRGCPARALRAATHLLFEVGATRATTKRYGMGSTAERLRRWSASSLRRWLPCRSWSALHLKPTHVTSCARSGLFQRKRKFMKVGRKTRSRLNESTVPAPKYHTYENNSPSNGN